MRERKLQLEAVLMRLANAIAEGQQSQTLVKAITEREAEVREITNKLLEPGPDSLQGTLEVLREFAITVWPRFVNSFRTPRVLTLLVQCWPNTSAHSRSNPRFMRGNLSILLMGK